MNPKDARTWSKLMRPGEVAAVFKVHPKTVLRWAEAGELVYVRMGRGHRRYARESVYRLKKKKDWEKENT